MEKLLLEIANNQDFYEIISFICIMVIILLVIIWVSHRKDKISKGHRYKTMPKCNADETFIASKCAFFKKCTECEQYY